MWMTSYNKNKLSNTCTILCTIGFILRKWTTINTKLLNYGERSEADVEIKSEKEAKSLDFSRMHIMINYITL